MRNIKKSFVVALLLVFCLGFNLVYAEDTVPENTVTGEQVWQAFLSDPASKEMTDEEKELMEPYIKNLPDALGGLVNEKVTIENLMKTQFAFLKYMMRAGYIERVMELSTPDELKAYGGVGPYTKAISEMLQLVLGELEKLIPMISEMMKQQNVTDEMVFAEIGLNEANTAKLKNNELMIRDILVTQPSLFFVN